MAHQCQMLPRQLDVGRPGGIAIRRRRVGDGAEVKYHLERGSALEEGVDIARWQQPRRRMLGQVAPFPRAAQMVDDDGLDAAAHQGRLQIRADEAGAASDQDHGARYTGRGESAERGWQAMSERPRFFDDLAGVAGGAISALAGLREEIEALARARIDEAIRRLDLVKREELDAMAELAANARAGQEAAEAQLHDVEQRLAALEVRVAALETQKDTE